jgi:hypothetical protein
LSYEEKNLDLSRKDIICKGCLGPLDVHWSADCEMMLCAREKGLKHCFECEDFPCAPLEKFATDEWEHHRRAVDDSKRMKKIGLEVWIEKQDARS